MTESPATPGPLRRHPSRGMYVLPSAFTAANIAAGFYAMVQSLHGAMTPGIHYPDGTGNPFFDRAALAIGFAVVFDGVDGRVARLTRTTSDFGKELDSLADVVTFGVAPALLAYVWGFRMLPANPYPRLSHNIVPLGLVVCFLFLICGACRLARFNISINPQPKNPGRPGRKYFVGMPIPAGAGVLAAVVHGFDGSSIDDPRMAAVWLLLIAGTGFLMVSNWRFWSGKEIDGSGRHPFQLVVVLALIIAVVVLFSEVSLMVISLGYLVSGVLARLAYAWGRRQRRMGVGNG